MSKRKEDFDRLVECLEFYQTTFNAPYGIITSTIPGKAKGSVIAYTVTFGKAATMDATAKVFSVNKVVLETRGRYEYINGTYDSVDILIQALREI